MKNRLYVPIIVILVFAIVFTLSACSGQKNKLHDIQHQISNYTDIKCITEKETYSKADTVIRYTLTNVTAKEAWINPDKACFDLQKQVDGVWKSVGTKVDHYWTEMAMLLPSGESETREINLEDYFYLPLDEGTYRIEIEGILSNNFEVSYEKTISYAGWSEDD